MIIIEGGHASDATIVIFGAAVRPDGQPSGTLRARVEAAAKFGRTRHDPLFIPTGGVGRFGPSEASVMRDLLRNLGVPDHRVILEDTATDTLSSVRAVRHIVARLPSPGPLFVATSAYHLPRCVLLCRLAGLPAHASPPPRRPAATRWRRRWWWRLREAIALPYDALLMIILRLTGRL